MAAPPSPPPKDGRLLRDGAGIRVYEAELVRGEPAVVKMRVREPGGEAERRRFAAELRFARALAHPSLPRLLDWGEDWMAFERLEGSLAEPATAAAHAEPQAVRRLLSALGDALAYVHALGVVHRDVKPAHVMFRRGRPVLVDFGIALSVGDPPPAPEICGTPAWMAPEQLHGGHAGGATDVWSLSALGLFLLTGLRPYAGDPDAVIARRLAEEPPAFDRVRSTGPASSDAALADLLWQGLGPPEERPPASAFGRLCGFTR